MSVFNALSFSQIMQLHELGVRKMTLTREAMCTLMGSMNALYTPEAPQLAEMVENGYRGMLGGIEFYVEFVRMREVAQPHWYNISSDELVLPEDRCVDVRYDAAVGRGAITRRLHQLYTVPVDEVSIITGEKWVELREKAWVAIQNRIPPGFKLLDPTQHFPLPDGVEHKGYV